jgi:hypothetical protein
MISDTSSNQDFERVYDHTPKQRAEYLVDIFTNITSRKKVSEKIAVDNAIKAVDELIKEIGSKYWYDVRKELEKKAEKL